VINYLHSLVYRPERGWDPVPRTDAHRLAAEQGDGPPRSKVDSLARRLGGVRGKRLLDLGGGTGRYSVAFALRGASVVWHDISGNCRDIVRQVAADHELDIEYSLGYMEDATRFGTGSFDIVFCSICWYYCRSDRSFARLIVDLLRPGGVAYIDVPTSHGREASSPVRRAQAFLYHSLRLKVGHPFPPPGRVPALFAALAPTVLEVDFTSDRSERIILVK
jgi:2-polyprenyl-3-methyl-5-hydroxy-6-metoxy-1,4-benzoquinol methylase